MFDVQVFNPHAPLNRHTSLLSCYRKHEQIKKNIYEQRCRDIEHAWFTPLMVSATGGLANEASTFYKELALLLASKWDHPYSRTLCWLRCCLAFFLLHSAIQSIRGARLSCWHAINFSTVVDLVNAESNIHLLFNSRHTPSLLNLLYTLYNIIIALYSLLYINVQVVAIF